MRKWIFKSTTLKTPFHIALSRMKLRSHCTFSGSNFCYARDKSRFIFGNILDWNVFINFIIFFNVLLFWFRAGQGLKKVGFSPFLKFVKISYNSE